MRLVPLAMVLAAVTARSTFACAQDGPPNDDAPPPEPPAVLAPPPAVEPTPPPDVEPTPAPPRDATTLPEGVRPLPGERPMRFFMTGGNTLVATRIGEDAEYFWVRQGSGALARIRKTEIGRMSYDLHEPSASRTPERPPSLLPLEQDGDVGERTSPPGRGLIVGGAVLFGIFYGGTLLFAPGADGPGELLLIPVFGPIVYGLARDASAEDVGGLAVVTALQGAGALMLYLGIRQSSRAATNSRGRTAEHGALLVLVPELSMRHVALDVTGVF